MPLDDETANWISRIGDDLAEKLHDVGLIDARPGFTKSNVVTLNEFIEIHLAAKPHIKPTTEWTFRVALTKLAEIIGRTGSTY